MSKHLERDVEKIHKRLMSLFAIVEQMIDNAVRALCEKRVELAQEVIARAMTLNLPHEYC